MTASMGPGREFDLIRRMLALWGDQAEGIGSDATTLSLPAGEELVVSTDTSVEEVHFRRDWLSAREIGYRAAAAALSDLAAAGAAPVGMLVAMTIPDSWIAQLDDLALGIGDAARIAGAKIRGGDTSSGAQLSLTLTVMGSAARPLTRAGARAGDRILLTGDVGRSGAALKKLSEGAPLTAQERERFAHPVPRIGEGMWFAAKGATAAIDVSDGLGSDLRHLAAASGVLLHIELDHIPVHAELSALNAMRSGEEYELMVAVPDAFSLGEFRDQFGTPITEIGRALEGPAQVELYSGGALIDLPTGYDHF